MTGTLYVIGIGPGDPELLTLKAVKILRDVPCIFFPKGKEEGISLARSIVEGVIDLSQKELYELHFPMAKKQGNKFSRELTERWDEIGSAITGILAQGKDAAFLTLGDPCIYSTYFYIHGLLQKGSRIQIEIIPGISSINLAFSQIKQPMALADEAFVVIPAAYWESFEPLLANFHTIVFMKVHKVFYQLRELLSQKGLLRNAWYLSKLGMKGERIIKDLREVTDEDLNYFSMVILKGRKDE
jgi:precorrin-2/cobalt-factor-2 C20-methyltransferase